MIPEVIAALTVIIWRQLVFDDGAFFKLDRMQRLVDGPFPAWMITASIAAMILSMIPVATVGLNHHMTMQVTFR
jgi:cbb3-type cytochrome oxidase subunit 1